MRFRSLICSLFPRLSIIVCSFIAVDISQSNSRAEQIGGRMLILILPQPRRLPSRANFPFITKLLITSVVGPSRDLKLEPREARGRVKENVSRWFGICRSWFILCPDTAVPRQTKLYDTRFCRCTIESPHCSTEQKAYVCHLSRAERRVFDLKTSLHYKSLPWSIRYWCSGMPLISLCTNWLLTYFSSIVLPSFSSDWIVTRWPFSTTVLVLLEV